MSCGACVRPKKANALGGARGCACPVGEGGCEEPNGCLEAEGSVVTTNYREVGAGRGQYEMVPQFTYVGPGHGSFHRSSSPWMTSSIAIFGVLFAVGVLFGVLILFQSTAAATTTQKASSNNMDFLFGGTTSPAPPFSCGRDDLSEAVLALAVQGWSDSHRTWCCQQQGRGCTTTTSAPYDCEASLADWEAGWAEQKKAWCCANKQKGCPTVAPDAYACTGLQSTWAFDRRYWCCWNRNRGCNAQTGRNFDAGAATAPDQAAAAAGSAGADFDCAAGVSNGRAGWSDAKEAWCCKQSNVGCQSATASAAARVPLLSAPTMAPVI